MDNYRIDADATLSPFEFYSRHKGQKKNYDLFHEDKEDAVVEVTQKKVEPRPVTPVDIAIKRPPRDHEELTRCFRERLLLRADLKHVTVDDQTQLADILTMAIISIWPAHRKQGPDPLLSDEGNKELQRRVAVYVVETAESLFSGYIKKAEEMNSKAVFSVEANMSRLKTQILQEANDSLNILKVRRKLAEVMRQSPDENWFSQQQVGDDLVSILTSLHGRSDEETKVLREKSYQQFIQKQLSEMKRQIPNVQSDVLPDYLSFQQSLNEKRELLYQESTTKESLSSYPEGSRGLQSSATSISDFQHDDAEERRTFLKLKKSNSMPSLHDEFDYSQDLIDAKEECMKRRNSIDKLFFEDTQKLVNMKSLTLHEDVEKLAKEKSEKNGTVQRDDLSPLLQVTTGVQIKKKGHVNNYSQTDLTRSRSTTLESVKSKEQNVAEVPENIAVRSSSEQLFQPTIQPITISVKLPNMGMVQLSDAQIYSKVNETKLTLKKHPTLYNEFKGEISDDVARDLDKHLFAGEEIQEVYDEITKTVTNEHLDFDKDSFVEPTAPFSFNPKTEIFSSTILQQKQGLKVMNKDLIKDLVPPWTEYPSADEWRNEPKFGGIGREDILKFNSNTSAGKLPNFHSASTQVGNNNTTTRSSGQHPSNAKLTKSYSAWITWYKSNLSVDDYKKFISKRETDFLGQIFHLYDSDEESDDRENNVRLTSAQLKMLKEREEQKEKLRAQKKKFEEGFWNVQCVSLGGLGKDPSITDRGSIDDDSKETVSEEAEEQVPPYIILQERLETIWNLLKMPETLRVDMAMKYSSTQTMDEIIEVVELWETVSDLIVEREGLLDKLEAFESVASDPNRFFEKGPNGLSVARFNEAKAREKLDKEINQVNEEIVPLLQLLKKRYGDTVTYRGRNYLQKLKSDRVEMLYWLQQERRKRAIDLIVPQKDKNMKPVPIKSVETLTLKTN